MFTKALTDPILLDAGAEGSLKATFSRFHVVDKDQDVTLPTAFTDGQHLELCWAHDLSRPIGDGVVRVHPDRAEFDGRFWLDTEDGLQSYRKVKNRGPRQEYSYTYEPLDADPGVFDGQAVRFLKRVDAWEVSPVFRGAGVGTQTEAIKAADVDAKPMEGVHACRLRPPGAFQADSFRTTSRRHEGKPYNVILGRLKNETTMTEQAYRYAADDGWSEAQARSHCSGHDGVLFEPAKSREALLVADLGAYFVAAKEGRELSAASRARLRAALEGLAGLDALRADLGAWLDATEPPPKTASARLRFDTSRLMARLRMEGLIA